jgi:Fe-S cluster assembly protein SufD
MTAATPFIEALRRVAVPDSPDGVRGAALDRFLAAGLPDSSEEGWRYTSLNRLALASLKPSGFGGLSEPACPDLTRYPGHVLAFQDGQLACHGTYLAKQIAGTLRQHADTRAVREYLGHIADGSALANLNLALWQDGGRVYVPAGDRLSIPIFVLHAVSEADALLHPRALVVLERDAEAILVEHYLGQTLQPYWQNAVTEIVLEDGARLTHFKVVEEGPAATHTSQTAVRVGQGGTYRALHLGLDGSLARHDMTVDLHGHGAVARIDAFDLADGRRHTDLHLRVSHSGGGTTSRVIYRGLADGQGRAIFDGHVVVKRGAQRADARQSCRGLLLSPNAEIDAMPRLEIYADDVQCGHGASIGSLDSNALFYLRSRGIDFAAARQLLLQGFAAEALGLLEETHLRDWLMPRLLTTLQARTDMENTI